MDTENQIVDDQAALWNGHAGHAWVEAQELIDRLFKPIEDRLVEAVRAASATHVLDVGCGTGSTTLAIARALGAESHCVGIDISNPMIAVARGRADREGAPASFVRADAQTHPFETASFDMVVSRFGVMFFDDSVRAFANLRRAARDGGELRFFAWRSAAENPFMTTAEHAAAPLLPHIPPRRPDAPGQFAFADERHVRRLLAESGWDAVDIRPVDIDCILPEQELQGYFTRLGPLGRVLGEADERTRAQIVKTVRAAFDPFVHGAEVRFSAACWEVGGRSASS